MTTLWVPTDWNEGVAPGISAAQLDRVETGISNAFDEDTLANRPAAASADRRLFHATDLGAWFALDTVGGTKVWVPIGHNRQVCDHLYDDFQLQHGATLTADGWLGGWTFVGSNWGSASYPSGARHSAVLLGTSAVASPSWIIMTSRNRLYPYIDCESGRSYPLTWESYLDVRNNAAVDYMLGCFDVLGTARPIEAIAEGFGFRVQDAGNYYAYVRRTAGDMTAFDTGVQPSAANGFDLLRIEIDSTTAIRFYIDNVEVADEDDTGTPPSAAGAIVAPGYEIRGNAAALKGLTIDYVDLFYKRYIV